MKVTLLNPTVLEDLYKNHGEFACECYNTDKKYAERVGKKCEDSGLVVNILNLKLKQIEALQNK